MGISLIAAMAKNRVIGKDNGIPWRAPGEMKRFKEATMGHTLVMGRKTFESIGRPLPGRTTIVITRDKSYSAEGCSIVHSLKEAIDLADSEKEIFIAGGSQIYEQAFPLVDQVYLTIVDVDVDGDAMLPEFDLSQFVEVNKEFVQTEPSYTCYVYRKQ